MLNFKFDISKVEFELNCTYFGENREVEERLYFHAPKEWITDEHPEADGATIMLGFANEDDILNCNPNYVGISPRIKENDEESDYDWSDISLEPNEIRGLVAIAAIELQEQGSLPSWADNFIVRTAEEAEKKDVKVLMVALVDDEKTDSSTLCVAAYSQETSRTKIINVFKGEEAIDIFNTLTSVDHYDKEEK